MADDARVRRCVNMAIRPVTGEFDVTEVRRQLDAQPDALATHVHGGVHLICGDPREVIERRRSLLQHPDRIPYVTYVSVTPGTVLVNTEFGTPDQWRSAIEFMAWLVDRYDCTIHEDGHGDVTGQLHEHGPASLFHPDAWATPLPWAGELIHIGHFREPYVDIGAIALTGLLEDIGGQHWYVTSVADWAGGPLPDEDGIADHLEHAGQLHLATDFEVEGPSPHFEPLGPLRLLTDGTYCWPSYLVHYLRRYHLWLPAHFVHHVREHRSTGSTVRP